MLVKVLLFICFVGLSASQSNWTYQTYFYTTRVDHFGFSNDDTFTLRYLVNEEHFLPGAPIFFYTGNEGAITLFSNNTGFMWDIAPEFNAMLVFAEHRYYGESTPYGNLSLTPDTKYTGYLNSEQALVDFSEVAIHIKKTFPGAQNSTVIAFGGSYGGMLASWARVKYPHVFKGAIASSAPVLQFTGITPCPTFYQIVTRVYNDESAECSGSIRNAWGAVDRLSQTAQGRQFLQDTLRICETLTVPENTTAVKYWLSSVWVNMAMINYPYPANFLEPLPAWPVKETCLYLTNSTLPDEELIVNIAKGSSFYFNYTGIAGSCFPVKQQATEELGDLGWDFQACTEMVMPFCSDGINDMFEPYPWNFTEFSEGCWSRWKVRPQEYMVELQYGGRDLKASSNIVFSNGNLDPWSGGGFIENVSDSVVALYITDAAHHLDLRSADPADPQTVIDARNTEKQHIRAWIAEDAAGQVTKPEKRRLRKKFLGSGSAGRPYRPSTGNRF